VSNPAPVKQFLEQLSGDLLILHDDASTQAAESLGLPSSTTCRVGHQPAQAPRTWGGVALMVADEAALRRAASVIGKLAHTRAMACWLGEARQVVSLVPRPEWPATVALQARWLESGTAFTAVRFRRVAPPHAVFAEFARSCLPSSRAGGGGLFVASLSPDLVALPVDTGLQLLAEPADASDPDAVVPPDVVLADHDSGVRLPVQDVIARAPSVVVTTDGPVGPLDEGVLNPRGYREVVELGPVSLRADGFVDEAGTLVSPFDPERGVTARNVRDLRGHLAVHLPEAGRGFLARRRTPSLSAPVVARAVAGLAMAGVPVVGAQLDEAARALLGPGLRDALGQAPDLTSPLSRDEHSVLLRRAGLREHSVLGWRCRVAGAAGIPHRPFPAVSIVMSSKREAHLEFALRQVARQRLDAELVLATHGYTADPSVVRERLGDRPHTLLHFPSDTVFGDVLAAAVAAASGDVVVKMDDDDWYGRDFLLDLLLARHYSGADVVGMTSEFMYLEELDRTIRRTDDSERNVQLVPGAALMVSKAFLADVGGYRPVRRDDDIHLLHAVHAAGGSVYRTHGLGLVVRRAGSGHTWDPGVDYFLDEKRVAATWEGFSPSRLLEVDPRDLPRALV
jgi:hypothetical protein